MTSKWPEFKLDRTWPAFCWLEGPTAQECESGWMEWLPEHETTVDEDIGNAARVYLSIDAARAWQAFRDWCGPSFECAWTQESDWGAWETDCGQSFEFNDGGPKHNQMRICYSCGGTLVEVAWEEPEDSDDGPKLRWP